MSFADRNSGHCSTHTFLTIGPEAAGVNLSTFCERLDERLRTDAYADLDASANGLQVGPGGPAEADPDIDHAAFAVDAAVETAERAADAQSDVLCVHHGLFWGEFERATGPTYDRLAPFFENDLALYVSHLPLDGHPEIGNAAGLAETLGLEDREAFGTLGGEHIGLRGRSPDEFAPDELRDRLATECDPEQGVKHLDFGPERIENVAIATGSAADWLDEAVAAGADAFVTGEGKQAVYHEAREAGIHVYLAGHYATETFGVRSLLSLAEEWGVETTFVDCPTGL
ncbi:putative hydrolase-oxidase [Halococcus salifodinae DSM 8989]|uniref:Putative hydrolase-oxidase n=1 Tax=Halococcus salifodinae DSM 8989 TaxID=1227456 RepID=M0N7H7_9EURY|nr:putative hydrolase-oxidase [Halococcus salifodinae DSM 8989]